MSLLHFVFSVNVFNEQLFDSDGEQDEKLNRMVTDGGERGRLREWGVKKPMELIYKEKEREGSFIPGALHHLIITSGVYYVQVAVRIISLAINIPCGSSKKEFKVLFPRYGKLLEVEYDKPLVLIDVIIPHKH